MHVSDVANPGTAARRRTQLTARRRQPRPRGSNSQAAIEVTGVTLAPADAAELAEMLQFPSDWLARDQDHLEASLEGFTGSCAYGT